MATLDLDARQGTLGRYVENRAAYAKRKGVDLPMPVHAAVPLSTLADRTEAQADERARLEAALEHGDRRRRFRDRRHAGQRHPSRRGWRTPGPTRC